MWLRGRQNFIQVLFFPQSNISICTVGDPMRSDNAWNQDHSQNVSAWWRIVKLQAWDSVSSVYYLLYAAVVFSLELNIEVRSIDIAVFRAWYFFKHLVLWQTKDVVIKV